MDDFKVFVGEPGDSKKYKLFLDDVIFFSDDPKLPPEKEPFPKRVIYLASGRALAGRVEDVITAPKLSWLYGAPIDVLRTAHGRLVVVGAPEAPHLHGHRHER